MKYLVFFSVVVVGSLLSSIVNDLIGLSTALNHLSATARIAHTLVMLLWGAAIGFANPLTR